jgi:hypothetical protein
MIILSQDLVKGFYKDAYTYSLESYNQLEEKWPLFINQIDVLNGDNQGDFWQRTTVVDDGLFDEIGESDGYKSGSIIEGYTAYGKIMTYAKAKNFTKRVLNNIPKMKSIVKSFSTKMGAQAKKTRETYFATIFNKGGFTSGDPIMDAYPDSKAVTPSYRNLAYDNKPYFTRSGNNRSSKGGATYYNAFALTLDAENFKTVYNHGMTMNNREEDDTRMEVALDTLLVPAGSQTFTAKEILNSTLAPYLSTNTNNVLKGIVDVIDWHYLTTAASWFLLQKNMGLDALKAEEPMIDFFEDKLHRCYWLTGEFDCGHLFWNWRFMLSSSAPTS